MSFFDNIKEQLLHALAQDIPTFETKLDEMITEMKKERNMSNLDVVKMAIGISAQTGGDPAHSALFLCAIRRLAKINQNETSLSA